MKIWVLDPAQLTPYYNIALCDALAQAGNNVRYIASPYLYDEHLPYTDRFETYYGYFTHLNYPWLLEYPRLRRLLRGLSYPLSHWQLLRQIRHTPPDILHIQWSRLPRFDHWFIRQVRAMGIPVVHTVHDVIPSFAPDASTAPLQTVYAEADRLIVHTEANRRDFLKLYPKVDAERIRAIPLISTPNIATPPDATREQARRNLNLPLDALIFAFFGAIRHYKGLDVLLSAFAQARSTRADLHLLIAGRPDTADDKALLDEAVAQQNVYVHRGHIPYEKVWEYHVAADVLILPYRSITQSAALISSMEFGRPVIVTNVGGLPETVDGNGWIVPSEDVAALSDAMLEAASDQHRLQKMGERSAEIIREKHTGSAVAQATIRVYQELIGLPAQNS